MTTLYSLNQAWPQELPFRIKLADGTTRTDPSTFTTEELVAWGYTGPFAIPEYDRHSEVLEWTGASFNVRPMTVEERQIVLDEQWSAVRRRRNELLLASDWTQLADSPADKAAWASYRQALRDITEQADPFTINWPTPPIN
jgi:hypothetical protein